MTQKELRNLALGLVIGFSSLSALATVTLPFSFKSGDPIRSGEVNANFSSLKAFADSLEGSVAGKQARVGAKCDDGSSIREIKEDGTVACELDDVGSGGSSYTAGAGLALTGAQFSLADGGVGTTKLADGAVTGAKLSLPLTVTGPGPLRVNATGVSNIVAIRGNVDDGVGVQGLASGVNGVGVMGKNIGSAGVGVSGEVGADVNGKGVSGYAVAGRGVYGFSVTGRGVHGQSTSGISGYFLGGAGGSGVCSFNGGAGWNCTSDRNAKENFRTVDTEVILESLMRMPVTTWNMRGDQTRTPHIGPVAQDFRAAFGMGESDTTINTADAQGVAFAAIKGLNAKLEAENARLRDELTDIQERLVRLETLLKVRK